MSGGFTPLVNKKSFLNNEEKKSTKESRGGWKYKSSKKKINFNKRKWNFNNKLFCNCRLMLIYNRTYWNEWKQNGRLFYYYDFNENRDDWTSKDRAAIHSRDFGSTESGRWPAPHLITSSTLLYTNHVQ